MKRSKALYIFMACIAVLAALTVWRIAALDSHETGRDAAARILNVDVAQAAAQDMPLSVYAVGEVESEHSVQIRAQVSGMLKQVYFREGDDVQAGQRLFLIDPAPYETALTAAKAALDSAQANADRLANIVSKEYVTQQEYQDAKSAAEQAQAAYKQAQINLSYTDIRAPIAGRTGSISVKAGNLVSTGDTVPLVTINQMQPILIRFSIPQQRLDSVRRYQQADSIHVYITHEDGSGGLGEGKLVFVDNAVDNTTGSVTLKARVPNPDERLWPGEFVGVRLQLAIQKDVVVIPQTAIQIGQDGNFVYIVSGGVAQIRPVTVDRQVNRLAVITSGLQSGETVVTRVPRNLRPGIEVRTLPAQSGTPSG